MDLVLIRWVFDDRIDYEGPLFRWQAEQVLASVGMLGQQVDGEHPRRALIVPLP